MLISTFFSRGTAANVTAFYRPGAVWFCGARASDIIANKNILFGSEMVGAVRGIDPTTGFHFDDTKRYVDALDVDDAERHAIFEGNARRVLPRLARA